jgi:hypothetical protein
MNQMIEACKQNGMKYKINDFLLRLPEGLSTADIAHLLHLDFGITRKMFDDDRELKASNPREIPSERLKIYAFMLHVNPEQLKNL